MIIFWDGCTNYISPVDSLMKWSAGGGQTQLFATFPVVRPGVRHLFLDTPTYYQVAGAQEDATFILKARVCREGSGSAAMFLMSDSINTKHITLLVSLTGKIQVFRGSESGTLLGETGPNQIDAWVWRHLEFKVLLSDTVGTVEVRLDGNPTPILNLTGLDTKNGGTKTAFDSIGLNVGNNGGHAGFCDIVLMNTSGAVNNDFTGDSIIDTLIPNGAGTTTQLIPTGLGTNYQNVDEVPADDADYNASPTDAQYDTYAMSNSSAGTNATVAGVGVNIRAFKDTTSASRVAPVIRTHATDYAGTGQTVALNPSLYRQMYETNPNTTLAWTITEVNAMEAGPKVLIP